MSSITRVLPFVLVALFVASSALAEPEQRTELPAGVSADWWSQVQRSIILEEYAITTGDDGFRAANPAHRFEARFDGGGLRLAPTGEADWEWGLSLKGWGRSDALHKAEVLQLSADEDRVELDRDSLTEWFVNRPDGLEHGFTIPEPPLEDGERLVLDLALAGGLRPVFAADGQAIDFYGGGNISVLRYAKLVVTDAAGETLPARMEPIAGGIHIVVEDSGAVYPITVDPLATTPSWTEEGEAAGDYFGHSVATAGDLNGDGYSDVVVGAYGYASNRGKVYVYHGGPGGLSTTPSWTEEGEFTGDLYGYAVATAGDVNGDGYADVIVGQHGYPGGGAASVYHGGPDGLTPSVRDWYVEGESMGDMFGLAVATAGDVNGDGYSDVVVGAPGHSSGHGRAYVYLGGPEHLSLIPSWTSEGDPLGGAGSSFGSSVATAGDVNGDGYSDVIVGAPTWTVSLGAAFIYLGGSSGLAPEYSWARPGATDNIFGASVSTAGDVNGDGYSDVVVGAYGYDSDRGKVFVYHGGPGGPGTVAAWTAEGEFTGDFYGYAVATAGDVNGDGYSDVIVGSYYYLATGTASVYLGGPDGFTPWVRDWLVMGEGTDDLFGYAVAAAGDVNGDGYSDVIVGAHGFTSYTGKTYLYLGGAGELAATSSWTAEGETTSNYFGYSVATAGDVNGDGYSDVVVGAYGYAGFNGKAYLYPGGSSGLSTSPSWTAEGQSGGELFGYSVATAGDVNGDGYSDLIVGARGFTTNTGKAYLYQGGLSGLSTNPSWSAEGEATSNHFGTSVATAGDVNGDGYSDVIVGARGFTTNTGKAYLYPGGAGGLAAASSWTATGEATSNYFGYSVATAGDVNGDGYSDVVVGAYGYAGNTGKVYVYHGWSGGLSASPTWTAEGELTGELLGYSVAAAGDVNGDGYSDVIVGGHGYPGGGAASAYLGGPGGLLPLVRDWIVLGETAGDLFGCSVATAGDVNGDGYSDVLVGARGFTSFTGKAYLYLGGVVGLSLSSSWDETGEASSNNFGNSVATAGDVNGDGYSDVVIGARGFTTSTGKTYLYLGGGGAGGQILPGQLRADLSAPIHPGAPAYEQQFQLGLTLRSPVGRVARVLQWQVAPWGGFPSIVNSPIQTDTLWMSVPLARRVPVSLSEDNLRYLWRARVKYHPAQSPFVPWSPWITHSGNGLFEADLLSTSDLAPVCVTPDEETYITTMSIDGNGKPVLHYQDPNQPADVTGYNIYRATAPTGPWTMIGSNVVDMDEGTPDNQYVDQTGDVGGPYYYEIAAWNESCRVEGPY
jgi:hypothetical protein